MPPSGLTLSTWRWPGRRVLRQILDEHRVLLIVSLLYIAIGGGIQAALHRPWPIQLTTPWFLTIWIWGSTLWLGVHVVERHRGNRARLSADQILAAILLATLAVPVQTTFQSLKQSLGHERGFPWDPTLAAIDRALHGGPAWHWYAFILDRPTLLKVIDVLYMMWFPALIGTVVWLCWTQRRELRQRALLALLLLWVGAGTVGAWTFASAGPCYRTASDPQAADLIARLDRSRSAFLARGNQRGVWDAEQRDEWLTFGGVSAMPSLHVGLVVLVAIIGWQRSRPLGAALWMYALVIQVGSVILGWHYAIDGYAGALCAWGTWGAAGHLAGHSTQTRSRARNGLVSQQSTLAVAGLSADDLDRHTAAIGPHH